MSSGETTIQLFLSNRLENLAEALIAQTSIVSNDPFQPETILIQNRGIARWLNLRRAAATGIQMNSSFLYPRRLMEILMEGLNLVPSPSGLPNLDSNSLFWLVYDQLPVWTKKPEAKALRDYLESRAGASAYLRRYQLALQIARHLDDLQLYRPDLLISWENAKIPKGWREELWSSIIAKIDRSSFPSLFKSYFKKVKYLESKPEKWPDNLHVFGLSAMPPVILNMIVEASRLIPVNFYLNQPTPLYWGDQIPHRKSKKYSAHPLHRLSNNTLLESLGKQGREFLNTLIDAGVFSSDETERFQKPARENLLTHLQADLFEITPAKINKRAVSDLTGLDIRICHTLKREVEVLHDLLLRSFEEDPDLRPDEVLVMAPDVEPYATAIHSIFNRPLGQYDKNIPYSIADAGTGFSSRIAHALLSFLKLLQGRFTSTQVLEFLSLPVISERFEFGEALETIRGWIEHTDIRWGIDANHRETTTGVPFEEYSWQQGVDRLLTGYLIHSHEPSTWESYLPFKNMEGSSVSLLNHFLEFWRFLEAHQSMIFQEKDFREWISILKDILAFLFGPLESYLEETQYLMNLISAFEEEMGPAPGKSKATLKVISLLLSDRLAHDYRAESFYSGTVTFCSLRPMRNVPAKFIAIIGMSEDAFPRQDYQSEFYRFPDGERPGDPSRRGDDRYAFLEALLSCRRQFYISYPGIDSQTFTEQPPSIVVDELLDALDDYYEFPDKKSSRQSLVKKERLQPFSPEYFQHRGPTSYSKENLEAAKSLVGEKVTYGGLNIFTGNNECGMADAISLDQFIRFFANTSKVWLNQNLEIDFPYTEKPLEEIEPLDADGLSEYKWGNFLLENPEAFQPDHQFLLNKGFPVGELRDSTLQRLKPGVTRLLATRNEFSTAPDSTIPLNFETGNMHIHGQLAGLRDNNLIKMRFGKVRPLDKIIAWIEHLAASIQLSDRTIHTRIIGKEECLSFNPVSNPQTHLNVLGELYLQGQTSPLPFFVQTSFAYAEAELRPSARQRKSADESAFATFTAHPDIPYAPRGEAFDPYHQLCFPDPANALGETFRHTAIRFFKELFSHMEGDRL